MAAAGGRFESAKSIEERKERTRIARAEVLRQAKANYEREERRKELKRLRGEDTWMLPDVNERVEQISQSSEDEWVEAVPSQTSGKEKAWKVKDEKLENEDNQFIQRDEWMTVDFMSVKTVSSSSLKAEKETLRKIEREKTQALEQSVEAFQLKLKEAEKTAFTKEDCRRERWRKPTCSERTQSSQESRKSYLVKYNKSSRDRYSVTDTANNVNKDRFSDVEKDNRSGFLETCRKESNPRQKQEFSSLGNLRPKFLRPSDDEELSFHSKSRNFEPSSSSSALVAQNSVHCGFRKPTESSEESLSSWSGSDGRERDWKHPNRKELDMSRNVEHGHVSEDWQGILPQRGNEQRREEGIKQFCPKTRKSDTVMPGKRRASTHEEKERVRYFHDDDNLSLNDLVKNEKMGTAENQNKLFMRMASKFMGKTDGDYYTLDDMFVSKAAERECFGEGEESQKKKAIAEHRSLAAQMEKCLYCFDSSRFPKHLIVAIGVKVYLCLPNIRSLTDGQCLIVPLQHHRAATSLDEDIWEEMQVGRRLLIRCN
ncbi:CWF19-like protein [Camelus ferus]|nr:CWF19-like protein [Camelus ferus]